MAKPTADFVEIKRTGAEADAPTAWVHPDAFNKVWEKRGWETVPPAEPPADTTPTPRPTPGKAAPTTGKEN